MARSANPVATIPAAAIPGQFVRSVVRLARALRHRREIMHLAELDDRMLKDIGLMRNDVDSALAEPLFHNPSWVLVRCAERHTRAERMPSPVRAVRPTVPVVNRASP